MGHRDITIRMAKNDDGDAVAELIRLNNGFQQDELEIDWHDLEPNWIVAECDGRVVGCIQVVPSKPIGRMELLAVDTDLHFLTKGTVVKMLTDHALAVNRMFGSQAVSAMISYDLGGFFQGALNRGWFPVDEGFMLFRRLP